MTRQPSPRRSGRIPAAAVAAHDAALVETSARLFREYGYAAVTIDMIAREAQASPKTIYVRYAGKLGLFKAAIDAMVAAPLEVWDGLDPEGDPEAVLGSAADRFLEVVLSQDVLAMERAIIAEAPRMPELAEVFYARGPRRGLDKLAAYFSELTAGSRLQIAQPGAAAEAFIGMIEGELVRRALFLNAAITAEERKAWTRFAVKLFIRSVEK